MSGLTGLVGVPHREKNLLAREFAARQQSAFLVVRAEGVAEGTIRIDRMDFGSRLLYWESVLRALDAIYIGREMTVSAVTNYTPVDLAAWALMDTSQCVLDVESGRRLERLVTQCFEVANRRFSLLIVALPSTAQDEDAEAFGRAEALGTMSLGLTVDERLRVPRFLLPTAQRAERVETMEAMMAQVLRQAEQARGSAVVH
jgi:hypothetical protein